MVHLLIQGRLRVLCSVCKFEIPSKHLARGEEDRVLAFYHLDNNKLHVTSNKDIVSLT